METVTEGGSWSGEDKYGKRARLLPSEPEAAHSEHPLLTCWLVYEEVSPSGILIHKGPSQARGRGG